MQVRELLPFLPVAVLAVGLVGTGYVTLERQQAIAEDVVDNTKDIERNEEELDQLQRLLLEQAGDQKVEIQELRGDIRLILRLLQDMERNPNPPR